jgi:hypothetical protein
VTRANCRQSVPCPLLIRNSSDLGGFVAPLAGKVFIDRWGGKTAAELIARFQETVDDPYLQFEDMNDETTVNITAYVLQVNGAKAGTEPLTRATGVIVSSITH